MAFICPRDVVFCRFVDEYTK